MARKVHSWDFPSDNTPQTMKRGTITLTKGKGCDRVRLKTTFVLSKDSGTTTLTDAEKQLLLKSFAYTADWGKNGDVKPLTSIKGDKLNKFARVCTGSEIEGYSDATTGLGKTLAASGNTTLVCSQIIPLGVFHKLKKPRSLAFGRSQMRTLELLGERKDVTIRSGIAIVSASMVLMVDEVPVKGDPVSPGIFYREDNVTTDIADGPDGMPLWFEERTAIQASTSLTNISVRIDDLVVHDKIAPSDILNEINDQPNTPAEGVPTDRSTVCYAPVGAPLTFELGDLPTGKVYVEQNTRDLSTFAYGIVYIPILPTKVVRDFVEHVAHDIRKKRIFAVPGPSQVGHNAAFAAPFLLADNDDKEGQGLPGIVAELGKETVEHIPDTLREKLKSQIAQHKLNNEPEMADALVKGLASRIPGATQSGRGFERGPTDMLERVARRVA